MNTSKGTAALVPRFVVPDCAMAGPRLSRPGERELRPDFSKSVLKIVSGSRQG